ncbi:hypothetical protein AGABI2DRAFT_122299 [Agaricus bisporus var. bisporus H97]|uniref:hypothetical protein n=1 Tax=Agaricus bisporus var. bisporus (strain H97 / ATCC MYA-4626 / FGSC 10389) TaxID=936046 RepID=UPI00029F5E41|nr:hypothetical protein AGABI2DRAFT_122299 [Agaricus bisporus var. bisporus H97]EKV42712.1 hypothetical protein AGABI2DRAFT_122299 [Agaricus bisporus var. bisporus H97]
MASSNEYSPPPQAPKPLHFPSPVYYEATAPLVLPGTSDPNEHELQPPENREEQTQLDDQHDRARRRRNRRKTRRRIIAIIVFIALLLSVCAVILVMRYAPERQVVVWVLVGLIGLFAIALLALLFPTCPRLAIACCSSLNDDC